MTSLLHNIPLYRYTTVHFTIHPWNLGCFQFLTVTNKTALSIQVHVFVNISFISLGNMPKKAKTRSQGNCMLSFVKIYKLSSRGTVPAGTFYTLTNSEGVIHFLHTLTGICSCHFFISAILIDVQSCIIVGLICIFFMANYIEHS